MQRRRWVANAARREYPLDAILSRQSDAVGEFPRLDLGAADPRDLRRLRPGQRADATSLGTLGLGTDRTAGRHADPPAGAAGDLRARAFSPSRCRCASSTISASCSAHIDRMTCRRAKTRSTPSPAQFARRQELQQRHPRLLFRGPRRRLVRLATGSRSQSTLVTTRLHHPPRVLFDGAPRRGIGRRDRQPPRAGRAIAAFYLPRRARFSAASVYPCAAALP